MSTQALLRATGELEYPVRELRPDETIVEMITIPPEFDLTTCEGTCEQGGCSPKGPFHALPHVAMLEARAKANAVAALDQALLDKQRLELRRDALVAAKTDPASTDAAIAELDTTIVKLAAGGVS